MKKYFSILLAIVAFQFAACSQTPSVVKNVSNEEFKKGVAETKDVVIIDLRTNEEVDKGYIKGAIQINYLAADAEEQLNKLDKNKTYYIYCAGGRRSAKAATYMETHNFKHIYNLEKGFSEWAAQGFPVEKK